MPKRYRLQKIEYLHKASNSPLFKDLWRTTYVGPTECDPFRPILTAQQHRHCVRIVCTAMAHPPSTLLAGYRGEVGSKCALYRPAYPCRQGSLPFYRNVSLCFFPPFLLFFFKKGATERHKPPGRTKLSTKLAQNAVRL